MTTRFRLTNKARRFVVLCLSLAITASCSDDEPVNRYAETHAMDFGISVPKEWHTSLDSRSADEGQEWSASQFDNSDLWLTASSEPNRDTTLFRSLTTRAETVTTDDFYDSFSVYGYAYKGADWENRTEVTPYFENETVTNQNGIWTTDKTRYWPGGSYRMHFFAYAPSDMAATLIIKNYTPVELKYTVPAEVTEQKDLVVATADVAGNHNQSVAMDFKHILTAVKVTAAKGMSGTIKRVALRYITNKCTYTFGGDSWPFIPTIPSHFELNFEPGQEIRLDPNAESDTPIADGANTFMMIPHELPAGAKLEITIADDNGERTMDADLSGMWPIGYTVTYRISKAGPNVEYVFSATDPDLFTGEGGSNPVEIQSYKTANGADKTPVSWENAGYYSKTESGDYTPIVGDAAPDWLQFPTYQANTTSYNVEVYQQYGTTWDGTGENREKTVTSPDKVLQKMQEIGSKADPVNLAGRAGAETTANCYIVNAPGWYKFPIVYGNALKNGTPNPAAYNGNCFVNHLDKQIKVPWIKDNGITVDNAALLWQDTQTAPLIDRKSIQVDGDYILFHIPQGDNCVQGNAVIAAKDAKGDVAWSWHIWVTLCRPEETFEFGNYSFFKALLGYREADLETFPKRDVYVKLVQQESEKVEFVHVSQDRLLRFAAAGNAPYYQHGRKDPFPGASLKIERNDGKYSLTVLHDRITGFEAKPVIEDYTLGFAIKNPDTYIGQVAGNTNWYWYRGENYDTYNGNETGYKDLWDNNGIKTVYDPCPAGYKIPTRAAFEKVAETDKANVEYINTGLYFINNKDQENEQRFFLQILNSRGFEGDYISEVSTSSANAELYCNESNGSTSAHYLHFNGQSHESYEPEETFWVSHGTACAGRCILPQKE